eukprot:2631272-Pyramimonas_sp.AAC.1
MTIFGDKNYKRLDKSGVFKRYENNRTVYMCLASTRLPRCNPRGSSSWVYSVESFATQAFATSCEMHYMHCGISTKYVDSAARGTARYLVGQRAGVYLWRNECFVLLCSRTTNLGQL